MDEQLTEIEKKISEDKLQKYMGSAKISITNLAFSHPCRQPDRRVIEQIKRDFEGEGCLRDKPTNRIPALISESTLPTILEQLSTNAETFKASSQVNPPQLLFSSDEKIVCLHGLHRILAAEEFLAPIHQWWVVDLYHNDLHKETQQALREGYSYSAPYASGDIFRHMRLCHRNRDTLGEQRWRSRLSENQERYVKMILDKKILINALDSVLDIQGIWRCFYIGSLNEAISVGLDEEIGNAIESLKSCWTRLLGNDIVAMKNLDPQTVQSIQSMAPAFSQSDFEYVTEHMKSRELFPYITNLKARDEIKERLLTTQELILSLWTILSDIRYFKEPAKILKTLLPPKSRKSKKQRYKTLRERFLYQFTERGLTGGTIELQQTASSYTPVSTSHLDAFDVSYQQIWLCSCRVSKDFNAFGSLQLADLAHRLGFSSPEIETKLGKDPAYASVEKCIIDALKVLRPNEDFILNNEQLRTVVLPFNDCLSKILEAPLKQTFPCITVTGPGEPLKRRCGYGSSDTHDLNHLFLERIHAPLQAYQNNGNEISSFYVKRSRHLAFFKQLNINGSHLSDLSRRNLVSVTTQPETTRIFPLVDEVSIPAIPFIPVEQVQNIDMNFQATNIVIRVTKFIYNDAILREVLFN